MVTTRFTTADELSAMGSDAPFELIQGELIHVSPAGIKANYVLVTLISELRAFVRPRRLGRLSVGEGGYLLETNPDSVVAPDIGFVRSDRLPDPIPDTGYLPVRPDLIVEVVSPTDERGEMRRKQALYDRVGIPVVWWVDPRREIASIHVHGKEVEILDRNGRLEGGSLLPGFSLLLSDVFDES